MRYRVASLIVALLTTTAAQALADVTPSPSAAPSSTAAHAETSRSGGTIDGKVSAVDFAHGTLEVDSPGRGKITVAVPPSTSVQGKDSGYHSVTDLVRGTAVQILTSEKAGRLTAQLIRIK